MNGTLNGILDEELTQKEIDLIGELLINPQLTQQKLADKLKIGKRTVAIYMSMFQDKKIIAKEGSKRSGFWKILK